MGRNRRSLACVFCLLQAVQNEHKNKLLLPDDGNRQDNWKVKLQHRNDAAGKRERVNATLWSCGTWRRVGWKNCTDMAENHADGSRRIQSVHCCQTIRRHILEKNNLHRHHLEKKVIYQDWLSLCWILKLGKKDSHQCDKKYWVLNCPWE